MRKYPSFTEVTLLSSAFALQLCVSAPTHLVYTSFHAMWPNIIYGLYAAAILAITLTAIGSIPALRRPFKLILSALILFYFSMTVFFPHAKGLLDGRASDGEPWPQIAGTAALLVAWLAASITAPLFVRRLVIVTSAMSVIFVGYLYVAMPARNDTARQDEIAETRSNLNIIGDSSNVFVFVIDMLQGSILEKALRADSVLTSRLSGFDFFTRPRGQSLT